MRNLWAIQIHLTNKDVDFAKYKKSRIEKSRYFCIKTLNTNVANSNVLAIKEYNQLCLPFYSLGTLALIKHFKTILFLKILLQFQVAILCVFNIQPIMTITIIKPLSSFISMMLYQQLIHKPSRNSSYTVK